MLVGLKGFINQQAIRARDSGQGAPIRLGQVARLAVEDQAELEQAPGLANRDIWHL
jgi:hypothetical protein